MILGIILDMVTFHHWNGLEGEEDCREDVVLIVVMKQNSTVLLFCLKLPFIQKLTAWPICNKEQIFPLLYSVRGQG